MPIKSPIAARLHFIVARESPAAVVFRRGPSKRVATLLWNLESDELAMGQWLKGRIYEMRSDLSPDGKYLIYFAMDGRFLKGPGSWTAVSRVPYLKALAFYPKGDCWYGGGLWTGNRTYVVNGGGDPEQDTTEVVRVGDYPDGVNYGGECPGVYFVRLQRDGWSYLGSSKSTRNHELYRFEKPAPNGWILRKVFHAQIFSDPGKGCYWEEHELFQSESREMFAFPLWRCAEIWNGEILWAEEGRLFRGVPGGHGIESSRLVADLREMHFEPLVAPY